MLLLLDSCVKVTCEVDVGGVGAILVFVALCSVTHDHPAAVGARIRCRGRRQNQLTVFVTLLDAADKKQKG